MGLTSLIRALPFVGALIAGVVSPRLALAQANVTATRAIAQATNAQPADAPSVSATQPRQRVAVATRVLPRGTVLSDGDFELRDTTVRSVSVQPDMTPVVAGWVTRRSINVGEILRSPAVEAPTVVNANSPVLIEWADGNVSLTVHGTAARNGALGERIPVRSETGKRFEATVVAPGRVRID